MLYRTLKIVPVVLLVLVVSTIQARRANGQDCPGLGATGQELCINIGEDPRFPGGTAGPQLEFRGPSPITIVESFGSHDVDLTVTLVSEPSGLSVTVEGTVERTGTDDTRINMTAQGGLHEGATLGGGSVRLVGSATGASVIQLGAGAGYDIGVGEPLYSPFPTMCGETLYGPGEFDCIENDQPLEEGSVAIQIILSVDITNVGDIVDIPAGVGVGDVNPGGIDELCLNVPTSFVSLCEEIQDVASTETPVFYGEDVAATSLFFQVTEAGPVDITIVPQGAPLFGALFMSMPLADGDELCSELVDSPLYPADVGATETFTLEPGTYYCVIHRETPGSDVPFSFALDSNECDNLVTTTTTTAESETTTTIDNGTTTTTSVCPSESIYGEHSEETELLRDLRDNVLIKSSEGQEIIRLYYQWSPVIVKAMEENEEFREEVKEMVDGVLLMIRRDVE